MHRIIHRIGEGDFKYVDNWITTKIVITARDDVLATVNAMGYGYGINFFGRIYDMVVTTVFVVARHNIMHTGLKKTQCSGG